jgi:hypothetical protein
LSPERNCRGSTMPLIERKNTTTGSSKPTPKAMKSLRLREKTSRIVHEDSTKSLLKPAKNL